jgi:toxin secretion/phage lysis holin
MPRWDLIIKTVAAMGGTLVTFLFGEWTGLLTILFAFVVIDYITGMLASFIKGKLSSSVGLKGVAKKVFIFCIIAVAHLVDTIIGEAHLIRNGTIFFYLANELLSIIENASRAGIPIPKRLKNGILLLKDENK